MSHTPMKPMRSLGRGAAGACRMSKTLFMETTGVTCDRSLAEITRKLVQAGANQITTNHDNGRISGVTFSVRVGNDLIPFALPVRTEPIFQILNKRRTYNRAAAAPKDREQAERVAWRQLLRWVEAQFALIQTGMVQTHEVFMPYQQAPDGRTMFQHFEERRMLAAPTEAK